MTDECKKVYQEMSEALELSEIELNEKIDRLHELIEELSKAGMLFDDDTELEK